MLVPGVLTLSVRAAAGHPCHDPGLATIIATSQVAVWSYSPPITPRSTPLAVRLFPRLPAIPGIDRRPWRRRAELEQSGDRAHLYHPGGRLKTIRQHPMWFFFGLAYLLTWIFWGTQVAEAQGWINFHLPQSLGYWGLATATYLVAFLTGGWPAVKDLLSRLVRWRVGAQWYVIALVFTNIIGLAAATLLALTGGPSHIGEDLPVGQLLPFFLANFPLFLFTEETAWRGFALPRLQQKHSALRSSVLLGIGWGIWHLPLFMIPGTFQARFPFPGPIASWLGFVALIIPVTILATWLFNHTRGSVLIAALFHTATNVGLVFWGVLTHELTLFVLYAVLLWLTAAVVVWLEKPERLARTADWRDVTIETT